ncbi:general stress protein [Kineococcus gynurae]|uniref:General stress protein n=1 Tax=Kineococcus gynurae TaxID=452979 RepID=A0ABV5LN78_9ACTN
MSNLRPFAGPQQQVPTPPQGEAIGRYGTYAEAQRAVDFLSDEQFPVQNVTIVGTGLQMVERVTGRLTYGRAAGAGAASGAWFGLLIGLMLSVFGNAGLPGLLTGLLVGAGFGMMFAVISYALTGGRRDFTSASQIVAGEYTVLCAPQLAAQAREVLGRLPNGLGRAAAPGGPSRWGEPSYGPPPGGSSTPGAYGPPPQPGSAPLQQPPPPSAPSLQKEPETGPVHDLSGPTYAEKMEEARRERRAAEQREREERERGQTPPA